MQRNVIFMLAQCCSCIGDLQQLKMLNVLLYVDLKLTSYEQRPHQEGLYYFEIPGDIRVKVTNEEGGGDPLS